MARASSNRDSAENCTAPHANEKASSDNWRAACITKDEPGQMVSHRNCDYIYTLLRVLQQNADL